MSRLESLPAREAEVGGLKILRALPRRQRRMVGPWCFLDRYGPIRFTAEKPMDVAPHPHIGIQTVSWLLQGEIVHHDSLGSEALMHPGQLNLMTSGEGIAHSEETPKGNSGALNGVQLWVALPDAHRSVAPVFDHYPELPRLDLDAGSVTLIAGELSGQRSPARVFSSIIGADIHFRESREMVVPLDIAFEHALFVLEGNVSLAGEVLAGSTLHYLGTNRDMLALTGSPGARVLLIGGRPFGESILMWWNFVARTPEEIALARADWEEHRRFGEVRAYSGRRLSAPDLNRLAPPNPAS